MRWASNGGSNIIEVGEERRQHFLGEGRGKRERGLRNGARVVLSGQGWRHEGLDKRRGGGEQRCRGDERGDKRRRSREKKERPRSDERGE